MYITKTPIDLTSPSALALVGNRQDSHTVVAKALPPLREQDTTGGRTLWRFARTEDGLALILVSPDRPDHAALRAAYGGDSQSREYELSDILVPGRRFRFDVEANPAVSKRKDDGTGAPRRIPSGTEELLGWLDGKGRAGGFSTVGGIETTTSVVQLDRPTGKSALVVVRFQGTLEVTDADDMWRTLTDGIGRGKAFGCGLVLLYR